MKVKIKRVDSTLPLPVYETMGSVGFDLIARESSIVAVGSIELIPANIIVEVPWDTCWLWHRVRVHQEKKD